MLPCYISSSRCASLLSPKQTLNIDWLEFKNLTHRTGGYRMLLCAIKGEAVQFLSEKKTCRKPLTVLSPSCRSKVNCKLQTLPQDRRHVTFSDLWFAVSHEKPDAKVSLLRPLTSLRRSNFWNSVNTWPSFNIFSSSFSCNVTWQQQIP